MVSEHPEHLSPMTMAILSVRDLGKRYGRRVAVDGVSFEVGEREVLGLLGPNGSGKTTILRMVTGYLRPSAGSVQVGGHDVADGIAARRLVGYVPEDSPLYPHMRVSESLAFVGRLRGFRGSELTRRVAAARDRLALGAVADTIIGRLSRGYRQRVALAQAALHEPRLLVLDEPTNGLDPRQIIEFRGLIRQLARDCAVLMTSHILGEIERIADRVAIMLDGRLLTIERLAGAGRSIEVRLRVGAEAAPRVAALLAAMPGVTAMARDGEACWRLDIGGADDAVERLAARLGEAGIGVVELAEPRSDLEALFLRLTASKAA